MKSCAPIVMSLAACLLPLLAEEGSVSLPPGLVLPPELDAAQLAMVTEPNSRGERGLLLRRRVDFHHKRLVLSLLDAGGRQLVLCGEEGRTVFPGFQPTEFYWEDDDTLVCFTPKGFPIQPHGLCCSGLQVMGPLRSRLHLLKLEREKSGGRVQNNTGCCELLCGRELHLEQPSGMQASACLESNAVLLWETAGHYVEALASPTADTGGDMAALRERAGQALESCPSLAGYRLEEISAPNARGERVVTLRAPGAASWLRLALLRADGCLLPMQDHERHSMAQTRHDLSLLEWAAEGIFILWHRQPDAHESWLILERDAASPVIGVSRYGITITGRLQNTP